MVGYLITEEKGGKMKPIKGYKAFDKDMKCRGFQYKEGEIYECEKAKCCQAGFHLCVNPLDVLNYYDLCGSIFCEAEALGKIDKNKEDSKIATTKIKIGRKLSLEEYIEAIIDFLFKICKNKKKEYVSSKDWSNHTSTEDRSQHVSSGEWSRQASTGDDNKHISMGCRSQHASAGDYTKHELNGERSVAVCAGYGSKVKGKKGCWFALTEWKQDSEGKWYPICIKAAEIDGKKIKEDTWYMLKNGKFIKVK